MSLRRKLVRRIGRSPRAWPANESALRKAGADRDRIVGMEIFQMLREQAGKRGKTLPEKLQLHLVEIRFEDGEIKENKRVLFAE